MVKTKVEKRFDFVVQRLVRP